VDPIEGHLGAVVDERAHRRVDPTCLHLLGQRHVWHERPRHRARERLGEHALAQDHQRVEPVATDREVEHGRFGEERRRGAELDGEGAGGAGSIA
jgi:hypothetical protein